MVSKDPICGNCGKVLGNHFHDGFNNAYCRNDFMNRDVFTDEPSDSAIMSFLRTDYAMIVNAAISVWKLKNGHNTD